MKRYAEVLRVPHVAALIASTLLARFPIGINALALILYLREQTGSYAVAGRSARARAPATSRSARAPPAAACWPAARTAPPR